MIADDHREHPERRVEVEGARERGADDRAGDEAAQLGAGEASEVAPDVVGIEAGDDRARRRREAAEGQARQRACEGELPELVGEREEHQRDDAEREATDQRSLARPRSAWPEKHEHPDQRGDERRRRR